MDNTDQFYYFAYASNLTLSLLEERVGNKLQNCLPGRLPDYGFRFNRKNPDGSARANIVVSESEDVFGLVCPIDQKYKDQFYKPNLATCLSAWLLKLNTEMCLLSLLFQKVMMKTFILQKNI